MPFFKKKTKTKTLSLKPRSTKKRSVRGSLVTKAQLYRAIRRNVETKQASAQYSLTLFNSSISSIGDLIATFPAIAQGSAQNERIGNQIKPLKVVITGYVMYNTHQASNLLPARLLGCRLFCFSDKSTNAYQNSIANYNLLDLGGSSTSFLGTALNYVTPHNNDQFKFYADKKFKILKPYGVSNESIAANSIQSMNSSLYHPFKIIINSNKLPSNIKYDATDSAIYPVNFAPYIALGYCDLTNVAADTTVTQIQMEFNCTVYYEDA